MQVVCTRVTVVLVILAASADAAAAAPEITTFPSLSVDAVVADAATPYTVQMTVTDPDGHADIRCLRVLFNYTESPQTGTYARGYLAWGTSDQDITRYGGSWDLADAAGGGRSGQCADSWGGTDYTVLESCSVRFGGQAGGGSGSCTVTWTLRAAQAWALQPLINDADAWAADAAENTGWRDNPAAFEVLGGVCPEPPPAPRAPAVSSPRQTTLDVAIHLEDAPQDLYAIRVAPGMEDRMWVQADGFLGFFPVFRSATAWGTVRVAGLLWDRSYTVTARRVRDGCPSAEGPASSRFTARSAVLPRGYYGAFLEPHDGVIHGAGQTYHVTSPQNTGFERYVDVLGTERCPLVFMDYTGANSPVSKYEATRARLEQIEAQYGRRVFPQFGYYIPSGDAVPTQAQLDLLVAGLRALGRPAYLRIGYEFNGTWYNPMYQPAPYAASFRMVTQRLRAERLPVATLWCAFPGYDLGYGSWEFLEAYYPGDEFVDWWSIDVFTPASLLHGNTLTFLGQAERHGKPVMIGEATPTGVGADEPADWDVWFVPFFELIHNHANMKGHTYINWDWANTDWPTWGDARLETGDPVLRANYIQELSRGLYIHAGPETPGFLRIERSLITVY